MSLWLNSIVVPFTILLSDDKGCYTLVSLFFNRNYAEIITVMVNDFEGWHPDLAELQKMDIIGQNMKSIFGENA